METEERRRSAGSLKNSKKGQLTFNTRLFTSIPGFVNYVYNLTDCEKRGFKQASMSREVVKEKLREKLELEKRALKIVERLLEDSVAEDFLVDCAKFITPVNYKDTIEERSIAKLCGYPICPNKLGKIPTQQFKISTKTNKVYDITERKCFCSNFCYKASKEFELQISTTPLWLRQHESPPQIKLLKKGDGVSSGSSGEEVIMLERRLQEKDIEDPLATQPEDAHSSQLRSVAAEHSHSESSDIEQEQDFVSSMVCQRQGPRVHWGDLPKQNEHLPSSTLISTNHDSHNTALTDQLELNITQVGMSKRGAAGLRDLLKNHTAGAKPDPIRLALLECLKKTLKDWSTDETLKFLYGAGHSLSSPFADVEEDKEEEEEELDEDDFDDEDAERVDAGVQRKASAPAPDYETLQKEGQQLELRVREFYKGTWILPEEEEKPHGVEVTVQDQSTESPVLPARGLQCSAPHPETNHSGKAHQLVHQHKHHPQNSRVDAHSRCASSSVVRGVCDGARSFGDTGICGVFEHADGGAWPSGAGPSELSPAV
ncbi:Putative RNA polymerase II subunit B1 CTD phosphatase rpap2 [Larimichthys crocea]|uniref:Uncharacterized protein n=1 Tax=Larimichthys crocea TaxID=215358 RepID=A0ACD3QTH9_LARCR|nr:Putative RNA polymerase II subunit B1 CTD phosphatase rpap2 [Larimichthys crocea]